jgi:transposase-like protein
MAKPSMDLSASIGEPVEAQDGDVLREGVRVLAQASMETEVTALVGAEHHEGSEDRTAYRNGTRVRSWDTRVGTVEDPSAGLPGDGRRGSVRPRARQRPRRPVAEELRNRRDSISTT